MRMKRGVGMAQFKRQMASKSRYSVTKWYVMSHIKSKMSLNSLYTQSLPSSKLFLSVIQTSQLMLYSEIIAVCSEIHTKHTNTAVWAER